MDDRNDTQLLTDFAVTNSQKAFGELVRRHINLVYASARRQVGGDGHLADDVTQAVFMILAKKAASVRNGAVLPAWLISTTRYAASNARALESRRRRHEHKAAAMSPISHAPADVAELDETLAPSLDEALAKLAQTDRSAVAMRYLQGMSIREVGVALGVSEEAAQKRVNRAVDKLRQFFARRGVSIESARLASGLAHHAAAHVAPAALTSTVVAHALASGGAASASASLIAKGTAKAIAWAHAKLIGAVAASVAIVAGGTTVAVKSLAPHSQTPTVAATMIANVAPSPIWSPPATQPATPVKGAPWGVFPNANLMMIPSEDYTAKLDDSVRRVPGGGPTPYVASIVPAPSSQGGYATVTTALPYRGKRICFWAWVKTEAVQQRAGLNVTIFGSTTAGIVNTPLSVPQFRDTTEWTRCQAVVDVPADAAIIALTSYLYGPGKMWIDGFTLSVVDKSVPATTDTSWHLWANWGNYDLLSDAGQARNGHATVLLRSAAAPRNQWGALRLVNRDLAAYKGKRVRISAMLRCADMNFRGGLFANVTDVTGQVIASANGNRAALAGTMGWLRYSIVIDVPPNAAMMESGVLMNGSGKIWVDDIKYEAVERNTPSKLSTTARR